jgi:tetratricopeptide (TPR) repeat protein
MKKNYIRLSLIVALMVAGWSDTTVAKSDHKANRQFESISNLLEKADYQRESGNEDEARKLYGATISAYQEFHRTFPDSWIELVQFRIAYCRNQLMNLLADQRAAEIQTRRQLQSEQSPPLDPDILTAITNSIEQCRLGHYAEAETAMQALIEQHPQCSPAYLVLGTACVGKGEMEVAATLLTRAVAIDPTNRDAHYNLCQLLIRADPPDFDGARSHYKKAIQYGGAPDADLAAVLGFE